MEAVGQPNVSALWIQLQRVQRNERFNEYASVSSCTLLENAGAARASTNTLRPVAAMGGKLGSAFMIFFLSLTLQAVGCGGQGTSTVETVCSGASGCTERLIIELDVNNLDVRTR